MGRIRFAIFGVMVMMMGAAPAALAAGKTTQASFSGDYFAAGGNLETPAKVTGDIYAAGGTINVDSDVSGDVLAVGGTINISGHVSGSVRVAGGTVTLSGTVDHNVTVAGGTLELQRSAKIGGNLVAAGGNVNLSGTVSGGVTSATRQLSLSDSAVIGGALTYTSPVRADVAGGAKVSGPVTYRQHGMPTAHHANHAWHYWLGLLGLVASLVMGAVLLWLLPRWMNGIGDQIERRFWPAAGTGVIVLIAMPILAVVVSLTIVGLPVGLVLGGFYLLGLYLAHIVAGFWLGLLILRAFGLPRNRYLALLIGVVLLWLLRLIPFVGLIVGLVALILGLGGQALAIWHNRQPTASRSAKS